MLKFVDENYPLPEKPEPLPGVNLICNFVGFCLFSCFICSYLLIIGEEVKELQRKRHSATPGVSMKGRVRKVAKWKPESDGESGDESDSELLKTDL